MSTENLQMILNAFNDAGEGALAVAILWVFKGYFMFTLGMAVAGYAIKRIANVLSSMCFSEELGAQSSHSPARTCDRSQMRKIYAAGMVAMETTRRKGHGL